MKILSAISLSLLTAIVALSASEQSKAKSPQLEAFQNFKKFLLKNNPSGIYNTRLRGQDVSIDIQKMLYYKPLKDFVTGKFTGCCMVSICGQSEGGYRADFYTDAYWDEKTYQFIDHESRRYG